MYEDDCDCDEVLRDVELYLDGELSGDEGPKIRAHLSGCSPCMSKAEFRKDLKELLSRKCSGEVPSESLIEKIRLAMEGQTAG